MKELRRVYEALSKIYSEGKEELSSERLELNIARDLNKLVSDINNSAGDVLGGINRAEASLMAAKRDLSASLKLNQSIEQSMRSFEAKSKELGLEPSDLPVYKDAERELRDFQNFLGKTEQKIDSAIKALK